VVSAIVDSPDQHRGEDRQVDRHHEVLEHEDRQHDRGLAVTQPAQVAEDLRDDPGRGDVGDAAHRERTDQPPVEDQRHRDTRRRVEHDVEQTCRPRLLQTGHELRRGVLQAEEQQEQHHTDFAGQRREVLDAGQRYETAAAERQAAEQVQRDG
jgi:hypothetical protein